MQYVFTCIEHSHLLKLEQTRARDTRPTFRGVYHWYQSSVRDMLTQSPATITAPTTEAAVYALLKHIEGFYGGPGYTPDGVLDTVVIEPQDEFALLTQDASWKWYYA